MFNSNHNERNEKYAERSELIMESKRSIDDEMSVLLRQLVMQNQLVMAALVLKAYFIRQ